MIKKIATLGLCTTLLASCGNTDDIKVEKPSNGVSTTINEGYMDKSVSPKTDFFQFANGTWTENNPVPSTESRWGSFNELDQANKAKLTKILNDAKSANAGKGTTKQLIGDYYASFINMDVRNDQGIDAIREHLDQVDNIKRKSDIPLVVAYLHSKGISSLFGFGVGQDLMNVDNHVTYWGQGGIGLPNKNYYTDSDKEEIRESYIEHISTIFGLAGVKYDLESAQSILNFETRLAESMMSPAERRLPELTYNKMSRLDMSEKIGQHGFDFDLYLAKVGSQSFDSLIVGQPEYVERVGKMMGKYELKDWKAYLTWNVLNKYAGHLSEDLVKQNFNFYGGVLSGKNEMKPIQERAIEELTNNTLSEQVGKAFVEEYFSENAKNRVNEMVDNLLIVFGERIEDLDWMSKTTKVEAAKKLNSIGRKLGFPDNWEDYSLLNISKDNYIANIDACSAFSIKKNFADLTKPVDKTKWGMPAHMVNAYYHPLMNEIAFPAGIMQPPFFDENAEDAVNYGRIGMVIGHEFTHGFDDNGSKFDAEGTFKNWWTTDDKAKFDSRTAKLGVTFESFCPIDGYCVNSALTMGENIADLGGITLAYHAYTRTDEFKSGINREGYTPAQRFFISFAQLWKINYTDEELKNRIENDSHSPGMYRVNGPLMNCPEFFKAFDVQEGDAMRLPEDKVAKIW